MDYYMGMIGVFGFSWAPQDFNTCTGQSLPIAQYQALYSLISTIYGGSGQVSFNLPNLQGRAVIGQGTLSDAYGNHAFQVGQTGGAMQTPLNITQLPSHNHGATFTPSGGAAASVNASTSPGGKNTPAAGDYLSAGFPNSGPPAVKMYVDGANPGTTVALGGVTGGGGAGTVTVGSTGNGAPVSLMQPYLVMNPCICIQGLYPMRP